MKFQFSVILILGVLMLNACSSSSHSTSLHAHSMVASKSIQSLDRQKTLQPTAQYLGKKIINLAPVFVYPTSSDLKKAGL